MQTGPDHELPAVAELSRLDAALGAALRGRFAAAAYDADCIARIERCVPGPFDAPRLPLIGYLLEREPAPWAAMAGLFAYDLAQPVERVATAMGDLLPTLTELRILRVEGDLVRSAWRIMPFQGLWVLSDRPDGGDEAVMGPGVTTSTLAQTALPAAGARVLDLGCGAGSLALVAASTGSRDVVASDLNARAVAVTRVNALLNGIRLDVRQGDGFAPVAGERFDLVLCQPPYVFSPTDGVSVTYLHGGARGDELARALLAQAPTVLSDAGRAIWSFDAPRKAGDPDLATVISGELAASADVIVVGSPGMSFAMLAMGYASMADPTFGAEYARAARAYRAQCDRLGFVGFQRNLVVLSRPARGFAMQIPAANVFNLRRPVLQRLLGAIEAAALPDRALAGLTVGPVPEVRIEERHGCADGADVPADFRAVFGSDSWCADQELSEAVALVCSCLATAPDVARATTAYAEACGASPAEVGAQVHAFVRSGLRHGLLALRAPPIA